MLMQTSRLWRLNISSALVLRAGSVSDEENRVKELLRLQIDAFVAELRAAVLTLLLGLVTCIKLQIMCQSQIQDKNKHSSVRGKNVTTDTGSNVR